MDWLDEKRDTIGEKLSKKEMKLPIDIVTGVFFLLLGAVILLIMPKQVPVSDSDVINGQAFPTLLMAVMMICSGVVLAKELYNIFVKKMPPAMKNINLLVEVKALEILAILLLTYVICRVTDLFVVGAIFCSLAFLIYFRCRKLSYYAITLTVAVLIWIAFRFGLNVNF
jgi:hypothetical protein